MAGTWSVGRIDHRALGVWGICWRGSCSPGVETGVGRGIEQSERVYPDRRGGWVVVVGWPVGSFGHRVLGCGDSFVVPRSR